VFKPATSDPRFERALGAYLGVAVGDALGAPVEFMTRREIAHRGIHHEMTGGGWLKLKPGQITDDTEMALCLGRAWMQAKGWNAKVSADYLAAWLRRRPIDVGNTCRRGIRRYMSDGSLEGPLSEGDGGNGAAMRIVPIALATCGDDAAFQVAALEQAHLTHHHPLSDAATLVLGRLVHILVAGGDIDACRALTDTFVSEFPKFAFTPYPRRASGYIVDTMQTVLHYFYCTDSFESCVTEVVNCGEDADTNGAIAGMLAGARYGVQAIPQRWLTRLDAAVASEIRQLTTGLMQIAK